MTVAIELEVTQPEGLFGLVALVTVIVVWFLFAVALRWLRWRGLDGQERETVARLRQQLANWSPDAVTIQRGERGDLEAWRDRLLARTQGVDAGQPGVREAIGDVRAALAARLSPLPRLAIYLGSEGAALAISVGAVIASAPALRAFLQDADVGPMTAINEVLGTLATFVDVLWGVFPGTNVVWALLTVLVLQGYMWLSAHAIEVAVVLLGLAAAITLLDRVVDIHGDRRLYPDRGRLFFGDAASIRSGVGGLDAITGLSRPAPGIVGWLVIIYLAGAVPAALGGLGALLGGLLAFALSVYAIGRGIVVTHRRLRETATLDDVGVGLVPKRWSAVHRDRIAYWYLLARRVGLAAGLLALPVAAYYAGIAIFGGHLTDLVAALLAAPLPLQLGVVLLAVVVTISALGTAHAAWTEVSQATARALHQQSVRIALFVSFGPLVTAFVTLTLLLAFGLGVFWAGFAAAVVAVAVRFGYRLWQFVAYKIHTREKRPGLRSVSVAGPTKLDLPAGDVWVARVNATELAWPEPGPLVDDVIDTVEARFDEEKHGPEPAEAYYEWLEDTGQADVEDFEKALSAEARSRFVELIQQTSGRIAEVDDKLRGEYGQRLAKAAQRTERELGRVSKDDRFYRLHERRLD